MSHNLAYAKVVVSIHTCREHTDASHDPIEWRSSLIGPKDVQRYEESPYFEVEIDFFYVGGGHEWLKI